jgi:hypothetical protein
MLPAATAPNAIVKEASGIPSPVMLLAGVGMNVWCVLTTVAYSLWVLQLITPDAATEPLPEWLAQGTDPDFAACGTNLTFSNDVGNPLAS